MVANRKVNGTAKAAPIGIGVAVGVTGLTTLIGAMIIAVLISREVIAPDSIGYGSMAVLLMSSLLGGCTAAALIKHRKAMVCGLTGLGYYGLLLCATALLFGGQYQGMGVTGAVIACGTGMAILLSAREPGKRKMSKRKH